MSEMMIFSIILIIVIIVVTLVIVSTQYRKKTTGENYDDDNMPLDSVYPGNGGYDKEYEYNIYNNYNAINNQQEEKEAMHTIDADITQEMYDRQGKASSCLDSDMDVSPDDDENVIPYDKNSIDFAPVP